MIAYSSSFGDLYNLIQFRQERKEDKNGEKLQEKKYKIGYFSSRLIKFLISFTGILKTCEGRDKLCAFIQYSSKFYSTILYHAIDLEHFSSTDTDPFAKHDALKNVEKSMSSGRKIFRFLSWIEDIKQIYYYIIYKDTSIRNIFKALMNLSSMFYHLFDNFVWGANVGVISEYLVGDIKLKNTKNAFSLLRNLIKIILDIYKFNNLYSIHKKNQEEVYEAFEKRIENFQTDLHKKLLDGVILFRSKLRRKLLDIFHSFLRICMLVYSLKFEPFYSNLHPIFIGFCGMLHSLIALYKALYDKNLSKENLETVGTRKSSLLKNNLHNPEKKGKNKIKKHRSLEDIIDEMDELPENTILDDHYFDNYYVDFNKDFPTDPKDIISKIDKLSILANFIMN